MDTESDRVVQFGTATFQGGALLEMQDTLVNPCTPIPKEASNVHRIFDADVADAQTFGFLGENVVRELSRTDDAVLCGYNALYYDVPLLNAEFQRHCYEFRIDPSRVLDPLVWLRYHHRDWPSRRLVTVAERLDVPLTDAHRASADAAATGNVLYRLVERGLIPDNVEEALDTQAYLVKMLVQEDETYGRFLYIDRENAALLRLGIGKHIGQLLRDVPASYLRWMLRLPDLPHLAASEIRVYV